MRGAADLRPRVGRKRAHPAEVLAKFETVLEEAGLKDDAISLRITGCPNGCCRPYLAEIGFVAKAPNKYALYLGASYNGTRLNRLVSPSITIDDAVKLLTPVIRRYALERNEGEGFGDYCDRVILPEDATFHSVGIPRSRGQPWPKRRRAELNFEDASARLEPLGRRRESHRASRYRGRD